MQHAKRVVLGVLLLFGACKAEQLAAPSRQATADEPAAAPMQRVASSPPPARMIIRNATISVVVRDAAEALRRVTFLAEAKGGYVSETRQWKEGEQVRATVTLRVPTAELTSTLAALRSLGVRTESEHVTAQDVTEEFADLGAQLRNLQATEVELRELLRTIRERTQKAGEVMEIYSEITKVRGEIERIQGRMNYLSHVTALSTITAELIPDALAAPVVEPGWQPVATVKAATRALVNSLKGLADVLVWGVLYVLPIALIFVGFFLALRAAWLRTRTP
jgi:hypothetical protein